MVSGHRTFLRVGGIWLLLAGVGHLVMFHWWGVMNGNGEAMQAVEGLRSTPAGEELWALFTQFSLAFALFLFLSGTASVIASRKDVAVKEARHWSGFAGGFWLLTFAVFLLEPVPVGLLIAGTAAFFHVAAFLAASDGLGRAGPAWQAALKRHEES
jgi:hypothetical protein